MLDIWFREHLEDQAITDIRKMLPRLEYNRRASMVHHGVSLFTALLIFSALFAAHILAARHKRSGDLILTGVFIVSTFIVILAQYLKRSGRFVDVLLRGQIRAARHLADRSLSDPFYYHFLVILLALFIPLAALSVMTVIHWRDTAQLWVAPGSPEHQLNVETIKEFMSSCFAIVGAQLALFTFMFSYLLGRYSSQIVKSLITHRAVLGAWSASSSTLVLLWVYFACGYPRALENLITPVFILITMACLIVTIWICVSGIDAERGVLYAGFRFGRAVRRRVKKSTTVFVGKPAKLWTVLRWLNLDWRDPERIRLYEPPTKGLPWVNRHLASLFNTANKAIDENQQDLLSHSLTAILIVLRSYIESRKTYYGSQDGVLSEVNNQMAALLKAASASPNELMPTLVVRCIGHIGLLSLQIADQPAMEDGASPFIPAPKRHALSLFWAGLLEEAFELTHPLLRTTAPFEAISQLTAMAAVSHKEQYFDTMATTFFTNVQKMHTLAVEHPDAYHRILGQKCIEGVMSILALASQDTRKTSGSIYRSFDQCISAIVAMAKGQFLLDARDFTFEGCGSILTSKTSDRHIVLQDIFYATLTRAAHEDSARRIVVRDLKTILGLITDLAAHGATQGTVDNGIFIDAFYEVSYLILRGLPTSLASRENSIQNGTAFPYEQMSLQDELDVETLQLWRSLFSVFFGRRIIGWEWESHLCAILGIGFANIADRTNDVLKNQVLACVEHMHQCIIKAHSQGGRDVDDWWAYLQLVGAWVSGFATEQTSLAAQIAERVGSLRSFRNTLHGYSGASKFEPYGYPTGHWGDFCLPKPSNLLPQRYMTQHDIAEFVQWQESLMADELLLAYYKEVEKTRAPLREEFYRKLREVRSEREKPPKPPDDESK